MPPVEISVTLVLPSEQDAQLKIADRLSKFVEHARNSGATVVLSPTPDDIERELAEVQAEIEGALPPAQRAQFNAQIARIEALNRFRRLADGLLSKSA